MTKRGATADGSDVRFANFSKDALREGTFAFLTSDPSGSGANCPPTPLPPGLDRLPPAAREAVEPFLRSFTVTNITYLPPDAPEPEPPYGRGETGHQAWRLRNIELQAAEYYRARDGLPPLTDAERRRIMRPARRPPQANRPAQPEPLREPAATLPDDVRLQAQALGWSADALDRLASLLHASDRLGEMTVQHAEIVRRSGAVQKFYNPDAPQPWKRLVETNREEKTKHA